MQIFLVTVTIVVVLVAAAVAVVAALRPFASCTVMRGPHTDTIAVHTVLRMPENFPFLSEWLDYHRRLGVARFYLYDNSASMVAIAGDNITAATNKYNVDFVRAFDQSYCDTAVRDATSADDVEVIPWNPTRHGKVVYGQTESISDYAARFASQHMWTAFIDVDEFLVAPRGLRRTIDELAAGGARCLHMRQRKMADRLCRRRPVSEIDQMLVLFSDSPSRGDLEVFMLARKSIIHSNALSVTQAGHSSIHRINVCRAKSRWCPEEMLHFRHYHGNTRSIRWIQKKLRRRAHRWKTVEPLRTQAPPSFDAWVRPDAPTGDNCV